MAKGLTYEEMVKMGARPAEVASAAPRAMSLDELESAGAEPVRELTPEEGVHPANAFLIKAGDMLSGGHMVEGGSGIEAAVDAASNLFHGKPAGFMDAYRAARGRNSEIARQNAERHKVASGFGTGAGIVATLGIPLGAVAEGAKAGLPLGRAMLQGAGQAMKVGAPLSFLSGLGNSDADLTTGDPEQWKKAGRDTAIAGTIGTALSGAAGAVAPVVAPYASRAAGWVGDKLKGFGIGQARNVIQGGSDIAQATRVPLSDAAAEQALQSGAVKPFRDTKSTYLHIDKAAAKEGAVYADIVAKLEANGVRGPDVRKLADEIFEKYAELWPKTGADKSAANAFLNEAINVEAIAQGNKTLGLSQSEALKQNLQRAARFERLKNSPTEEVLQETSATVRAANERAIEEAGAAAGEGSATRALADRFVPQKQKLGKLLEARTAAERGATKASGRQPLGLKDYLLGAATGDPATAFATAIGSSIIRNRLPSALAAGSYGAGRALQSIPAAAVAGRGSASMSLANPFQRWAASLGDEAPALAEPEDEATQRRKARAKALKRRR